MATLQINDYLIVSSSETYILTALHSSLSAYGSTDDSTDCSKAMTFEGQGNIDDQNVICRVTSGPIGPTLKTLIFLCLGSFCGYLPVSTIA